MSFWSNLLSPSLGLYWNQDKPNIFGMSRTDKGLNTFGWVGECMCQGYAYPGVHLQNAKIETIDTFSTGVWYSLYVWGRWMHIYVCTFVHVCIGKCIHNIYREARHFAGNWTDVLGLAASSMTIQSSQWPSLVWFLIDHSPTHGWGHQTSEYSCPCD